MRILLTGVTGQVGGALALPLSRLGAVVTPKRSQLDLALPETITAALDGLSPELIVNPAAYTAVDRAEDEPELAYRVNAAAPEVMAKWAHHRGVPIIHFSTDYVFDGSGQAAWREIDKPAPLSIYGASKLAGEEAIRAVGGRYLIVRTSWVYADQGHNFMLTIARLAAERKQLRIVADQYGAPTSARVIADAVMKILERGGKGLGPFQKGCDLLHVACAGETNWCEFASAIIAGLRARDVKLQTERADPISTEDYPTKARRPQNSRLALNRLHDAFGISPPSWQQALQVELDALVERQRIAA